MADTLFADVSYFQRPVDDSYPYQVLSIRVSDGTFRDPAFANNYRWMRARIDSGHLVFGIVYTYLRPNWQANVDTVQEMLNDNGGLHPRVCIMLDVESGGNPAGDGSDWINRCYWALADYAGSPKRIIGYANKADFFNMWMTKPAGLRVIGAGYPTDPKLPGQVAHQYTNGSVDPGPGIPMGASPFGNCDMNSANGLDPYEFAAACGIETTGGNVPDYAKETWDQLRGPDGNGWPQLGGKSLVDAVAELRNDVKDIRVQLRGPNDTGWPQLGQDATGHNLTLVDALAAVKKKLFG
jgi:hypothetical protein